MTAKLISINDSRPDVVHPRRDAGTFGRFIAVEGHSGTNLPRLGHELADLDYVEAINRLREGSDNERALVWVSPAQPSLTSSVTAMVMVALSPLVWGGVREEGLPSEFWVAAEHQWYIAHSATVIEPLLAAGYDVVASGWIASAHARLRAKGVPLRESAAIFTAVREPDAVILLDAAFAPAGPDLRESSPQVMAEGPHGGADGRGGTVADERQRAREILCRAAAAQNWTVLSVDPGETTNATVARLAPLVRSLCGQP